MKKFTIFLLTFLFLIGFINVNAQNDGDGGPTKVANRTFGYPDMGIFCSNSPQDVFSAGVAFNVDGPAPLQVTGLKIFWTTTPALQMGDPGWQTIDFNMPPLMPPLSTQTFDGYTLHTGLQYANFTVVFDNLMDLLNGNLPNVLPYDNSSYTESIGTIYFYAEVTAGTGSNPSVTILADEIVQISIQRSPELTIAPEPIGIMCEGGTLPNINVTMDWVLKADEYGKIDYKWTHTPPVGAVTTVTGTLTPNVDFTAADAVFPIPNSFKTLNDVGMHEFKFEYTIYDIWDNEAVSCNKDTTFYVYVSPQPTVEIVPNTTPPTELTVNPQGVLGICENATGFDITVMPTFPITPPDMYNTATTYGYKYTLYVNGNYFSHYENTIPAGDAIPEAPFAILVSELEICTNVISAVLEVYNTDPNATLTAGCKDSVVLEVTVWPRPIITIAPKVQEVCSGEDYEVLAFATPQTCGATSFDIYSWTVNATVSGSTVTMFPAPGNMDSVLYENNLTTLLTVIDEVEFFVRDNNGCLSLPDTAFITIHPLPIIYLDEMIVPNPVCYNHEDFILGPVYILDENGQIYVCPACPSEWKGDGVYSEVDDDGITYWMFNPKEAADLNGGPGEGNWNIELWYYFTNEHGCTDSAMTVIRVYDLPVIPFEYPEELCARENAVPTWFPSDDYLPSGPITFAEFSIDPPTGLPIDPVTGELFLWGATPGEYVITYIYYDSYCWNFSTDTILVHPLPVIDEITQDVIPCVNETATLTVHISEPEMSKVNIQWWNMTNPPTYIPAQMGSGVTQTIVGSDIPIIYKVIVTNTETMCFDSLEYIVEPTVNPVDTIIFNMLPGPYCNNSIVNLDATRIFTNGFEGTVQNFQWGICEFQGLGDPYPYCHDIPLTDLSGQYKIEALTTTEFVKFYIRFNTEGYNCPYTYWSDPIYIIQTIKVDLIGNAIDTVCHGGSVELRYKLSNIDPSLPIWYRILENNEWYKGVVEVHQVNPGSDEIWFTTLPALHTNENGPESYCYAVEVWQYPTSYIHAVSPYPPTCFVTSDCHKVMVLKDPVLMLTCPGTINKLPAENPVFTANLSGGVGEPYYYWYLQTELVQEGPQNTYELDDLSILGTLGTYRIDVKATQTYSGCDAELVTCWFEVECPPMTIEIKGPAQACVGEEVTLYAVVVTDAEYTVQWKKGDQYLQGLPGYSFTKNTVTFTVGENIDKEKYTIEVSNCGCEVQSTYHELEVIPKTVIWVDNYTICENGAVEVTVNTVAFGGNEVYRYIWFDADGEQIDITYINKRIFNYDEMTDVVTNFSVQTQMLTALCSSNIAEFSITELGKLDIVTLHASDTIICVNNTVLFTLGTDENIEEFGTPVYTWWVDGFPTDAPSLDFLNLSFTSLGKHYVNVQITYPGNTCEFVTNDIYIEVRELFGVEISGVEEVCMKEGVPEYLTAYVEPYNAPDLKYQWYENGLPILGGNAYKYAINHVPGTYTYMVIVTDTLSGCEVQAEPHTVIVDKAPVITGITAVTKTICQGETLEFSHIPPINNVTYSWYINGVEVPGANLNIFSHTFDVEGGPFVVKVKATSNVLGCESDPVTVATITVKAEPEVTVGGPDLVCNAAEQAPLYAIVNPNAGNYSYQWYLNDEIIDGGTGATQVITNVPSSVPYLYYVIVTDNESGCVVQSAFKQVTVEKFLTTGITADKTEICRGASVILTADVSGDNNFDLQWYATLGTQTYPIDGAIYPNLQITPEQTMTYHFVATQIGSGCTTPSNPITITVIQIPEAPVLAVTPALVCSGDQITISTTATGMITWYKNDFAQPFSGPTPFNSITDQPVANHSLTTYNYYATVTTVGTTVSCVSDVSAPVTVTVHPLMDFVITGYDKVCTQALGETHAVLHALPNALFELQPGVVYEYSWSYVQGNNPNKILLGTPNTNNWVQIPNNLPVNDIAAPYTFYVEVKAIGYNCHYTTHHVMNILPKPTVTIGVDNPSICMAGTVVATASPYPNGDYNFTWNLSGNAVPGNFSQMTFNNNFTYGINNISVHIQLNNASESCFGSTTIPVNVLTQPFIDVTQKIAGLDLAGMCVGGKVDLTAQILEFDVLQIAPNVFTYEWTLDGNPYAAQGNTLSKVFDTKGTYTFKVQAKSAANVGCFTDIATSTVKVVDQPKVSIYPKDYNLYEVCPGAVIELIAVTEIDDPTIQKGEKYKWNVTDWLPFTNQIDPLSVTINYTGVKSFFLNAEFENPTCNAVTTNTVSFTIANAPQFELSIAPQPYFGGCTGNPIELNAVIKGGVGGAEGATIQWKYSLDGAPYQPIVGQQGGKITFIPVQEGSYTFMAAYTSLNPLSGCAIAPEDGMIGPMEVGLSITPKAVFETSAIPNICTNNPLGPVDLPIKFTGIPPFAFCIEDNFGGKKCFTDIHDNPFIYKVNPSKTTQYTITTLEVSSKCIIGTFKPASITVYVTDVIVNQPVYEVCGEQVDVLVLVSSDALQESFATVEFLKGGATQYVPILPYGDGTSVITINIPEGTPFGLHDVKITIDGCEFVVTIIYNHSGAGSNLIHRRYEGINELLVVSNNSKEGSEFYNGGYNFTSYQWYKNGELIQGATQQWYQDPNGINGKYHVKLGGYRISDGTPIEFSTCPMDYNSTGTVKAYPVPAGVGEPVYVELDLTTEELDGAFIDIYDAKGAFISQVKVVSRLTKVDGFKAQGTYFGRITTGTNEIKAVKFLIVK